MKCRFILILLVQKQHKGVMGAKLNRFIHKIAIQLHLVAESCTICSSRSRRPVRKLLDTLSYIIHVLLCLWLCKIRVTWVYDSYYNNRWVRQTLWT